MRNPLPCTLCMKLFVTWLVTCRILDLENAPMFLFWNLFNYFIIEMNWRMIFFSLRLNMTSLACVEGSGLKFIFRCNIHLCTLCKSSQICSAVLLRSPITENKEVSSATNFEFDLRFSDKSAITIRGVLKSNLDQHQVQRYFILNNEPLKQLFPNFSETFKKL